MGPSKASPHARGPARRVLVALVAAALVVACKGGGGGDASGGCRDDRDCDPADDVYCVPPGTDLCGSCNPADDRCDAETPCADGLLCVDAPIACACDRPTERRCVPPCVDDTVCLALERCDPGSGLCVPRACAAGDPCPDYHHCDGSACIRDACDRDRDCGDGAGVCVLDQCYEGAGFCSGPVG